MGFRPFFILLSCTAQPFIVLSLAISCKFHVIGSCCLRLNLIDRLYKMNGLTMLMMVGKTYVTKNVCDIHS